MQVILPLVAACLACAGHTRRLQSQMHDTRESNAINLLLRSLAVENPQGAFNSRGVASGAYAQHMARPAASALRTPRVMARSRYDDDGSKQNGVDLMSSFSNLAASVADVLSPVNNQEEELTEAERRKLTKLNKGVNKMPEPLAQDFASEWGLDIGFGGKDPQMALSRSSGGGDDVRSQKLAKYLDNELEGTDNRFVRALALIMFCGLFASLYFIYEYYGGFSGMANANTNMGTVSFIREK